MSVLDKIQETVVQKAIEEQFRFMTSADVIMKACGLHFETIRAIARKRGVEIEDASSRCIDEELLSLLADAHVRQMKSYYYSSKRHLSELSGEDLAVFFSFCDVFKRPNVRGTSISWNDIDTDAVRRQFIRKVHEQAEHRSVFSVFSGEGCLKELSDAIRLVKKEEPEEALRLFREDCIIKCIRKSLWLYLPKVKQVAYSTNINEAVRMVTLTARYYIFPKEDGHIA